MRSPRFRFQSWILATAFGAGALVFVFCPIHFASAATNIVTSPTSSHWAWNDAIGWIDFYGTSTAPLSINVGAFGLTGYASSSAGWISLDCTTSPAGNVCNGGATSYNVTNDGSGLLGGWAWNDAIGWISFCGRTAGGAHCQTKPNSTYEVTIDSNGNFSGWAWNDAIGWISFSC